MLPLFLLKDFVSLADRRVVVCGCVCVEGGVRQDYEADPYDALKVETGLKVIA